jgi:hypothetical protein
MAKKKIASKLLHSAKPTFTGVSVTASTAEAMTTALESQHRLQFVIKWTTQKPLILMSLQVKDPDGLLKELLTNPQTDTDNEILVNMGLFSAGDLTVRFVIGALGAIPKVATLIIEDEQKVTPFKPAAGQPLKKLEQGEQWKETGTYKVGATS